MKTIEEQRNEFVALCHDLKIQLNPLIEHIDILLGSEGEHSDEKQKAAISHLRDRCQKLLDLIEDCLNLVKDKAELLNRGPERAETDKERLFAEFVLDFTSEVMMPLSFIIGVSRSDFVEEWFGPLNNKQREELNHIHVLGQKLLSITWEIRHLKSESYDSGM